ncbi:MAG: DUF4279 domain-containing protein [Verrucomicrobia bacterium]|nr:DUF4279 domain-containing protein [Verrucomicrobiota bacterium]
MTDDPEYLSSATLMILGDDLVPEEVSRALALNPDQSWVADEKRGWGGWKLFIHPEGKNLPLEEQLAFWCRTLAERKTSIVELKEKGYMCALDLFVITATTASIILSSELQRQLAELGLELRVSIALHHEGEQTRCNKPGGDALVDNQRSAAPGC